MKRISGLAASGLAAVLLGACASTALAAGEGDETSMALKDAPAAALQAAQAARPDASFSSVAMETEDGVVTYEFSGAGSDGTAVEVDVDADGNVLEIETPIALEDLPQPVKDALALQMPDFSPSGAEQSLRPDGSVVYELDGLGPDGEALDVEVAADGESAVILNDQET